MKVFVITQGEYSDYHICGIFSTKENAETNLDFYTGSPEIEEWEVDKILDRPPGTFPFSVRMDRYGNGHVERESAEDFDFANFEVQIGTPYLSAGKEISYMFRMWARDKEHATKIANEKRIQLLESNQWPTYEEWMKSRNK